MLSLVSTHAHTHTHTHTHAHTHTRTQDTEAVTSLSDALLRDYVQTGRLDETDVLGTFGQAVLESSRLAFLGKRNKSSEPWVRAVPTPPSVS